MEIKKIFLEQTFNTGNYTNKKLGIEAEINSAEDEIQCFMDLAGYLKNSFEAIQEEETRLLNYELEKEKKTNNDDDMPF